MREELVARLMNARRAVAAAKRSGDATAEHLAHDAVGAAKIAFGERRPLRWEDGSPDLNRRMAKNTSYSEWYTTVESR